jgi:inorganic pyrophosphatase
MKGQNLRMEFVKLEKYSPWHDIESMTESEHYVNAVIEIPQGTLEKFEVSTTEEWNSIKPDLKDGQIRKLKYDGKGDELDIFHFDGMPHAYGMIPRTFEDPMHKEKVQIHVIGEHTLKDMTVGGDQDPLDLFILSDRPLPIG